MRIVHVTPSFPPNIGGLPTVVYSISRQLAKEGHNVSVYTRNIPGGKKIEIIDGVIIHRIPVFFSFFRIPVACYLSLCQETADIFHVHTPPPSGVLSAIIAGKLKKRPLVLTYHSDTVGNCLIEHFLAKLYNRFEANFIFKNFAGILVASKGYQRRLLSRGLDEERVEILPNGVDVQSLGESSQETRHLREYELGKKKLILFVGALKKCKGVEYLIEAIPRIVRKIDGVELVIIGDGEQRNKLRSMAKRLGVTNYVSFRGTVIGEKLSAFYEAASVVVLPSISEAFGLVVLEAMTHGKPVVVTRIAGLSELIIDHHNGVLVEPRNPEKLADAVIELLSDRILADTLSKNGREFVKRYSWRPIVLRLLDIYQRIIKDELEDNTYS